MIETTIYNFLKANAAVPWYLMRPKSVPRKYGLFEKTGETKTEYINTATFAFQSYAPTLEEAAEISKELRGLIERLPELDEISKVSLQGEYNFTNTLDKQPRYQAVFSIVYYEGE